MAKEGKISVWKWRGILADAPRGIRWGLFALLAVAVASLAFTQLGLVGLGTPGQYVAYGNVLLAIVMLAGLLFGIPLGTLIGVVSGAMTSAHAILQPLDYFETSFISPVASIIFFALLGFLASLMLAIALRNNPSRIRRVIYIVIIALILSVLYSIVFVLNAVITLTVQMVLYYADEVSSLSPDVMQDIVFSAVRDLGNVRIQLAFDAGLMIVVCLVVSAVARKILAGQGRHHLLALFRGWLLGVVVLVFMVAAGITFSAITEQAKASADDQMTSEIDYLCNQLNIYDKRLDLVSDLVSGLVSPDEEGPSSLSEEDFDQITSTFSIDSLLDGYTKEADGTVVVFSEGRVLLSDDEEYEPGTSWEEYFSIDPGMYLSEIAEADEMFPVAYNSDSAATSQAETLEDFASEGIATQVAYMRVGVTENYYVMLVYPATMVFESRTAVMASTTLSVLVLLIVIFVFTSLLLRRMVIGRIDETNGVLAKITGGELHTRVDVRNTLEFASLSDGINTTVNALRGWIAEAETRMETELNTAKEIQKSALPQTFPPFPDITRFDIFADMNPAREVGGDFYDFFLIGSDSDSKQGKLGFVVADVSGKSVPAALFMMTAKTLVRDYMQTGLDLGEAIENANQQLCEGNEAGMFVTVFAGVLDYATGHVTYVNAGHNPPLVWQNGAWHWLTDKSGLPLGLFEGLPYESFEIDCGIGDQFLMYTDGVTEAMNENGELYGEERLKELLESNYWLHPRRLVKCVRDDVKRFANGAEQSDDITMMALEVGVPPEITVTMLVPARVSELPNVTEFMHAELERRLCPVKALKQLDIAIEELFVNVASYAYPDATPENPGIVRIGCTYSAEPPSVVVEIADDGIPYDPMAKPDAVTPDDIMEVPIGGLGILMAKRSVDEMTYERRDNSNVVTLKKRW